MAFAIFKKISKSFFGDLFNPILDPVDDFLSPVTSPFDKAIAPIADPINNLLDSVGSPVKDVVQEELAPVVDPIVDFAGGALEDTFEFVAPATDPVMEFLGQGSCWVFDGITNEFGNEIDEFGGLVGEGANEAKKGIDFVEEMWATSGMGDWASGAWDDVGDFLGF